MLVEVVVKKVQKFRSCKMEVKKYKVDNLVINKLIKALGGGIIRKKWRLFRK